MQVRNTEISELSQVMRIYNQARSFMREVGNPNQWINGYPSEELITQDIEAGNSYVIEDGGAIRGVFTFIIGDEPTYQVIEDGKWRSDTEYGTIHRIASDGTLRGLTRKACDYGLTKVDYLRIDTHRDNKPMQAAVTSYGFARCGIIHVADGSERIAYDYMK